MEFEIVDIVNKTNSKAELVLEFDDEFQSCVGKAINKKNATKLDVELFVARTIENLLDKMEAD